NLASLRLNPDFFQSGRQWNAGEFAAGRESLDGSRAVARTFEAANHVDWLHRAQIGYGEFSRLVHKSGELQTKCRAVDFGTAEMVHREELILGSKETVDLADVKQTRRRVRIVRIEGTRNIRERNVRFSLCERGDRPIRDQGQQAGRGEPSAKRFSTGDVHG